MLSLSLFLILLVISACLSDIDAFKSSRNRLKANGYKKIPDSTTQLSLTQSKSIEFNLIAATTTTGVTMTSSANNILATALGYLMACGAMMLYTPMIYDLLRNKQSEGYSTQTWIFQVLGLTACIAYPFRKGFPISTYIENIALTIQSLIIYTLISIHSNQQLQFLSMGSIYALICTYLFYGPIPSNLLGLVQILSTVSCNYAMIPQIFMNFKLKSAKWSAFSALLSAGGNFIRIFTTLQLTKDKLVLAGHILGFATNSIMLAQIYLYRNNK